MQCCSKRKGVITIIKKGGIQREAFTEYCKIAGVATLSNDHAYRIETADPAYHRAGYIPRNFQVSRRRNWAPHQSVRLYLGKDEDVYLLRSGDRLRRWGTGKWKEKGDNEEKAERKQNPTSYVCDWIPRFIFIFTMNRNLSLHQLKRHQVRLSNAKLGKKEDRHEIIRGTTWKLK